MKNENAMPAMKTMDGKKFVRVADLARLWNTSTSSILATDKPHHVPEEHIRRIDGRVWCSLAGLRYRLKAAKQGSQISGLIREFLDTQAEKKQLEEDRKEAEKLIKTGKLRTYKTAEDMVQDIIDGRPKPTPTDLGTAALIADARRTASQALTNAQIAEDNVEEARDVAYDAKADSENNAKSLDAFDDRIAAMENDSYRRFDTVMNKLRNVERRQGDAAVNMTRLEQRQRLVSWALSAVAAVQALAAILRLARR